MIRNRFVRSTLLVFTAALALSCVDSPTSPPVAPTQAQNGLLSGLIGAVLQPVTKVVGFVADATGITVHPVAWGADHENVSHKVSGVITPWGGTLTIPETDFAITFPAGALSQSTLITITADPNYVAYKMEPTGTRFARPVVVTQLLRQTSVYGQPLSGQLFGAYIADDLLDLGKLLNALEIESSITIFRSSNPTLPESSSWTINHFSRYMLASG
ncbi:MAG TPA: hypothetical protein VIH53_02160 [Gemmatimonadaceae bacterium]